MKNVYKVLIGLVVLSILSAIVYSAPSWFNPTACSGVWQKCTSAYSNTDGSVSYVYATSSDESKNSTWANYVTNFNPDLNIQGVMVRLGGYYNSNANGRSKVRVSNDGGITWGPAHTVGGNTNPQMIDVVVTNDFAWTVNDFNNQEFMVKVSCYKNNPIGSNSYCYLDHIPVAIALSG